MTVPKLAWRTGSRTLVQKVKVEKGALVSSVSIDFQTLHHTF
jgi:hypothetical protein